MRYYSLSYFIFIYESQNYLLFFAKQKSIIPGTLLLFQ
jgi:hypothetical protein